MRATYYADAFTNIQPLAQMSTISICTVHITLFPRITQTGEACQFVCHPGKHKDFDGPGTKVTKFHIMPKPPAPCSHFSFGKRDFCAKAKKPAYIAISPIIIRINT